MKILLTLILTFAFKLSFSQTDLIDDLLSTWDKHVEMNQLILKELKGDYLRDTVSSGGRNVAEQFAHMHNVRVMWLTQMTKDLPEDLDNEIDDQESLKGNTLLYQLRYSNQLIRAILETGFKNKIDSWSMSPARFMAYLISHESHTRGQILLALKQSGHPMPPQVAYGIWEW